MSVSTEAVASPRSGRSPPRSAGRCLARRDALASGIAALLFPGLALGQVRPTPFRVAILGSASEGDQSSLNELAWLRQGLEAEGWVEGRHFIFDRRYVDGDYGRFTDTARLLLEAKPGAVVVSTIAGARAVQGLSKTVPIVMLGLNDPIRTGLVASLSKPGGNITGIATQNEELQPKLFRMMREALPAARKVAVLLNPSNPSSTGMLAIVRDEATVAGMTVDAVEASTPRALDGALQALARAKPDVLFVIPDVTFVALSQRIVSGARVHGSLVIGTFDEITDAGGFMSYGRVRRDTTRRAASYLKRIADGANPADLPVEQPTQFRLVVNAKVAKDVGLTIPPSILARADEVIE